MENYSEIILIVILQMDHIVDLMKKDWKALSTQSTNATIQQAEATPFCDGHLESYANFIKALIHF